jgi:hypothetical protein
MIPIKACSLRVAKVESHFQEIHILIKLLQNRRSTTQYKLCIEVIYFDWVILRFTLNKND